MKFVFLATNHNFYLASLTSLCGGWGSIPTVDPLVKQLAGV